MTKTYKPLKYILLCALSSALLLTSCAKINKVSTNLDPENFAQYFDPMKVKIYEDDADFKDFHYEYAGLVEGEDCQLQAIQGEADPIKARTQARLNAYNLGANAVVFSSCTTFQQKDMPNSACLSTVICYASAYRVDWAEKSKE